MLCVDHRVLFHKMICFKNHCVRALKVTTMNRDSFFFFFLRIFKCEQGLALLHLWLLKAFLPGAAVCIELPLPSGSQL